MIDLTLYISLNNSCMNKILLELKLIDFNIYYFNKV